MYTLCTHLRDTPLYTLGIYTGIPTMVHPGYIHGIPTMVHPGYERYTLRYTLGRIFPGMSGMLRMVRTGGQGPRVVRVLHIVDQTE